MLLNLLAIGVGGAAGTFFRFFLNSYTLNVGFPIGTLIENIMGSFLLGLLTGWYLYQKVAEWLRLGLGVGLCGGFTTMSTLAADSLLVHTYYSLTYSLLYIMVSIFGGISFALTGFILGERWGRARFQEKEEDTR